MPRKIVSEIMLTPLFKGMLTFAFNIQPVRSALTTITVPHEHPTIQKALDATSLGDTIFVRSVDSKIV